MRMLWKSFGAYTLIVVLLAACTPQSPSSQSPPVTSSGAPTATPTASDMIVPEPGSDIGNEPATLPDSGMAVVENIEVRILESFPVQVQAVVTGYLPDSCTTITAVEAVNEGTTFRIRITTERPADAMCAMVITNFEQVVPLETTGLAAGSYQVVVNDLSVSFELPGGTAPQSETGPQAEESAFPVVESDTEFVMAQVDLPIYDKPQVGAIEIGMIAGGQIARVTGASPDGAWWRVICPDDTVGDCWVSAAPEMTAPASLPD